MVFDKLLLSCRGAFACIFYSEQDKTIDIENY
jgi:hypothetical protein